MVLETVCRLAATWHSTLLTKNWRGRTSAGRIKREIVLSCEDKTIVCIHIHSVTGHVIGGEQGRWYRERTVVAVVTVPILSGNSRRVDGICHLHVSRFLITLTDYVLYIYVDRSSEFRCCFFLII